MHLPPSQLDLSSFSDLDDSPAESIANLIPQIVEHASTVSLRTFTSLLLDRTLRLLRQGSRDEILAEALAVSSGISGEIGLVLQKKSPETFGAWTLLDTMLSEAGRRSDRASVPSILLSARGHGHAIIELLAGKGQPVQRSLIKRNLNLAEARLSHLLHDLEEADIIVRSRPRGGREVLVDLGPIGREVAAKEVLPTWLERLASLLKRVAAGDALSRNEVSRELITAGAPSHLAASRLAEAIELLAEARRPIEGDFFQPQKQIEDPLSAPSIVTTDPSLQATSAMPARDDQFNASKAVEKTSFRKAA